MLRKIFAILLVFVVVAWAFTGCKDKEEAEEPKTMDAYRQEAEQSITDENAEEELEKEIKAIEAEVDME